jgi:uncharacterized protein YndB with AHSA1/START domain
MTPVGLTKTQGWEIGVRRTFPVEPHVAWNLLTEPPVLSEWLGQGVDVGAFAKGYMFVTDEGGRGEIRSFNRGSLIRLRWQPPGWDFESTLQVRVLPAKTGTTVSFHHEHLQSGDQRAAMQAHWSSILDKFQAQLNRH